MKKIQTKLSLMIGIIGLISIPNIAYSLSLNDLNSFDKIEQSISIAQNNDPSDLMNQGWDLYKAQQYQEAINYYDQAINIKPDFIEAWLAKGIALYELEMYEDALISFDQVIEIKPDFADAYVMRSGIYLLFDNVETAISDLETATQLYQSQNNTKQYQETLELLQIVESENNASLNENEDSNITENEENSPDAFFAEGYYLYESGKYEEAIIALDQAIAILPDFGEAYRLRGAVYFIIGNKEKSVMDLEFASQIFTDQNNTEGYQKTLEILQFVQEN